MQIMRCLCQACARHVPGVVGDGAQGAQDLGTAKTSSTCITNYGKLHEIGFAGAAPQPQLRRDLPREGTAGISIIYMNYV